MSQDPHNNNHYNNNPYNNNPYNNNPYNNNPYNNNPTCTNLSYNNFVDHTNWLYRGHQKFKACTNLYISKLVDKNLMDAYKNFDPMGKYSARHGSAAIPPHKQQPKPYIHHDIPPSIPDHSDTSSLELTLRINRKGWDINIFKKKDDMEDFVCANCNNVAYNAVELSCASDDDLDSTLYCNVCLSEMILDKGGYCPVHGGMVSHQNPLYHAVKAIRKKFLLKLTVICPHCQKNKNNKLNQIIDTLGNDQKEGQNDKHMDPWSGSLRDLINKHLSDCINKHKPSFLLKIKNEKLSKTIITLNKTIAELMAKHSRELNKKNITIRRLNDPLC